MGLLRWENFTTNLGFLFRTKFNTKLRDSKYLLSVALLYVFPMKNISNAASRFPILYSTKLPPEGEASIQALIGIFLWEIRSGVLPGSLIEVSSLNGNLFRYGEAKLRVLRMLHQLLNFVSKQVSYC
jgi:hypothetical protein